jgi:hypothetical protein
MRPRGWPGTSRRPPIGWPQRGCPSPISRPGKMIDVGMAAGMIRPMRHVVATVIALRFALSTRRDLLLEMRALRHQVAVLARSSRRFRPSDRLVWLILRRMWPQWRDALVLVQPATVDRWHRDRFDQRWWRRSRRPGRPRIDSQCRDLIALGRGESSLGRSADSRRAAQARNRQLRTHGVAVPAGAAKETVTNLAYIARESPRPVHIHFAGAVTVRVGR